MGPYYDILVRMAEIERRAMVRRDYQMRNIFTEHPLKVGEGYFKHLLQAMQFSIIYLALAFIAIIHAVFPFWFVRTASEWTENINKKMQNHRHK